MHPSPTQKKVPMVLWAEGIFMAPLLGLLCVMPIHVLLLCFWIKGMNHFSSPIMMPWKKSQPLTKYPFINCEEIFFFYLSLCSSINKWETHQAQTSQYPKLSSSSQTVLCSTPVPADISLTVTHRFSLVVSDFSFVSLSRCTSQVTTKELIGNVCVPIFEVFYPLSDIVRVHAGISISTRNCVWIPSVGISFFQDILSLKVVEGGGGGTSSSAIFSHWNMTT